MFCHPLWMTEHLLIELSIRVDLKAAKNVDALKAIKNSCEEFRDTLNKNLILFGEKCE